ncbi:MAG: sodium:proton antiporter [Bacteroidetes bacterium]|nr:sodium:proton antiporter [Bacteroidota bacterium]
MFELAGVLILGVLSQYFAWKFKIPAILPLIMTGLIVGPISAEYFSSDGTKWIEPIWNGTEGLLPEQILFHFISLSIGLILFEGGLTLKFSELKKMGPVIAKLITLGAITTFIGVAIPTHYILGISWEISFLFSALVIVTGPTVISPILRNIPLKKNVSTLLKWESILIDPIGALVAVLVFEFINAGEDKSYSLITFYEFSKFLFLGILIGYVSAKLIAFSIKKNLIPNFLINVLVLGSVLTVFVFSEVFAHESGLLSVVVMGVFLGNSDLPQFDDLMKFKESISVLLISILFILLASNIQLSDIKLILNWQSLLVFSILILVIRPLGVFISTSNSSLSYQEKIFISWIGPRGIVAAGIASLFGIKLVSDGMENAEFLSPMVFMVVFGTVFLNSLTARTLSKILGVFLKNSEDILIIGASKFSRQIALYLESIGKKVVLTDSNKSKVSEAKRNGLNAINSDIYSNELLNDLELSEVGYLFALTGNEEIDKYAVRKFKSQFGENGAFRLYRADEVKSSNSSDKALLFGVEDLLRVETVGKDFSITENTVLNEEDLIEKLSSINKEKNKIPLFLRDENNQLNFLDDLTFEQQFFKKNQLLVVMEEEK